MTNQAPPASPPKDEKPPARPPTLGVPPAFYVAAALTTVAAVVLWIAAPGWRPLLLGLGALLGVVGVYPYAYVAYRHFSGESQRERLRDDFSLLGLVQEGDLEHTVNQLYQTVYGPTQFMTYIGLIVLASLLVIYAYLQRNSLAALLAPEALTLIFYAWLGAYVFSIQELIRRYNTYDLQPQVYSGILVRMLVAVVITGVGAGLIAISGGTLGVGQDGGDDPQVWAAVLAFVIGAFPNRGLRWFTTQADKVLNPDAPAESELPLRNLLGLNALHEARLAQMGLDDAQNLATVDIRRLLLTTQFDTQQIVHWIDQAILYVKVGSKLQRYRDAKITTFHEFWQTLNDLSLTPRVPLAANVLAARQGARDKLAAALGMTDIGELDRLGDHSNYPNYAHLAEYYARIEQVARQRATQGMEALTGALRETDYERAIETARPLLARNPRDPALNLQLGTALYRKGMRAAGDERQALLDEALRAYTTAIEQDDRLSAAYFNRSLIHQEAGKYQDAIDDCNRALGIDSRNAGAYNNRGLAHQRLGYVDLALKDFDAALELDDRLGVAYVLRAVIYNLRREFDKAEHDVERAYLLDERTPEMWVVWGNARLGLQQYESAVEKYSYAVGAAGGAAVAYAKRGYAYYLRGEVYYGQAEADFKNALQRDANLMDAHANYGLLLARRGQVAEAIEHYLKALETPGSGHELPTRYNLALAYYRQGQIDNALALFETIMKEWPESDEAREAQRYRDLIARARAGSGGGNS